VLCHGRVVVDGGVIPGLDIAQLKADADAAVRAMQAA
jgi:hypothetical protein